MLKQKAQAGEIIKIMIRKGIIESSKIKLIQ
jgi:hypothetical protein